MPTLARRLLPFLAWRHRVTRETLRADLVAGLIAAVIVVPQGVAFATLAGMPPEYGLYGAMLPAIVGALWGSSWHLVSGPTNATSLMVFATVGALAAPFSAVYVSLVLTLNLMVGLIKLGLGVARLGALVNFISTTVIVGFTAGAGLLDHQRAIAQLLRHRRAAASELRARARRILRASAADRSVDGRRGSRDARGARGPAGASCRESRTC